MLPRLWECVKTGIAFGKCLRNPPRNREGTCGKILGFPLGLLLSTEPTFWPDFVVSSWQILCEIGLEDKSVPAKWGGGETIWCGGKGQVRNVKWPQCILNPPRSPEIVGVIANA